MYTLDAVAAFWSSSFSLFSLCIVAEGTLGRMSYTIRSPLLRAVHDRVLADEIDRKSDHSVRYYVDNSKLSAALCDKFLQCGEDEETKAFLEQSATKSDFFVTQMYHTMAKSILGWIMSPTSINGFLRRGSMFVYSTKQFGDLLGVPNSCRMAKLLDLGAGDGCVTKKMSSYFSEVYVTETSVPMTWRLEELGYKVLGIEEWHENNLTYDVISCLNLVDRCERPIKLLRDMRRVVTPNTGRVLVAVVLPFKPYVEFGGIGNKPREYLHIYGSTFEEQVKMFIENVFEPGGFEVETFTRLPYLCEGDLSTSYYMLNDAVFVLKPS